MRRLTLLVLIALVVPLACKKPDEGGDGGADGAASASASASASAPADTSSATSTSTATVHFGPPALGAACRAGVDTNGCSADKSTELTCGGGVWRANQTCRGPGACAGTGAATTCDVGTPIIGDVCGAAAAAAATCVRRQALHSCTGGKWTESLCVPPAWCHPAGTGGATTGCR